MSSLANITLKKIQTDNIVILLVVGPLFSRGDHAAGRGGKETQTKKKIFFCQTLCFTFWQLLLVVPTQKN